VSRRGKAPPERPAVYTVVFHPPSSESWLVSARHRDLRLDMARCSADIVGLLEGAGVMLFAAGFLHAPSTEAAVSLADRMLAIARSNQLAMVFGIDVGPEAEWAPLAGPPESLVFACDRGRRLLWPARQLRPPTTGQELDNPRTLTLAGLRAGVVVDGEVFNASLRRRLARERPDLILLPTHVGPNARWREALAGLATLAPTLIAGESLAGDAPSWTSPPSGWTSVSLGGTPAMTLYRYRPADAAHAAEPELKATG